MMQMLVEMADTVETAVKSSDRGLWNGLEGMGADGTETLGIDRIAEDTLIDFLEEKGNPFNVLSEECGFLDFGREKTLVMDPIDGTYNAIMDVPFYSVSLAVVGNSMSDAFLGLIRNLSTGDEFRAEKGKGAFRNGEKIKTRRFSIDDSIFSVFLGKRAHKDSFEIAGISKRVRTFGSASLEMAMVASGSIDLYYYKTSENTDGLRIVDIAASALVLREAGGEVYNGEFIPLDMELDVRKRSSVAAVGDRSVLEVLI